MPSKLRMLYDRLTVRRTLPYDNIYFCCSQKTGSQWFRQVLSHRYFYKYSGLLVMRFGLIADEVAAGSFDWGTLPPRTMCLPLYIDYSTYESIPKPPSYRTFFILRDPRDIVVSWYFSTKYSHPPSGRIPQLRLQLEALSFADGLRFSIDTLLEVGLFDIQRSWKCRIDQDPNARLFLYEDFADDNVAFAGRLFEYLGLSLPPRDFQKIMDDCSFTKLASGRKPGDEDQASHYRKGQAGDWKVYFDDAVSKHFLDRTRDLLEVLGYAASRDDRGSPDTGDVS